MATKQDKGYRRSWKNLLINKRYQLRFTLFMVGLSTLLMLGLGIWVLREAKIATTVGINEVRGRGCSELGKELSGAGPADQNTAPAAATGAEEPAAEAAADTEAVEDTETAEAAGAEPAGTEERPRIQVEIGEMQLQPPAASEQTAQPASIAPAALPNCLSSSQQEAKIAELEAGYDRIKLVLAVCGLLMVLGLTLYGIKTTHKVAGPLHKVSLYFDKMQKGTYDQVYSLRKGDQLVEFYEHFKSAHEGLRAMQQRDIEVLRDILEVAEREELGDRSPEIAALLDEMRQTLERKEKSLE